MPSISLIMPVFNCIKSIKKSVQSIEKQTFSDFELILVDDGSTDGSGKLCDDFASHDLRVKVIHKDNGGAGSARNMGIMASASEFLMFPDSDDWFEPDMLEAMYNAANQYKCDIVISGFQNESRNGRKKIIYPETYLQSPQEVRTFFAKIFPEGFMGYPWNKLYRTSIIHNNQLKFPDMRRFQDGMFNLDFFSRAQTCFIIEKALYHYCINDLPQIFSKYPCNIFNLMEELCQSYYKRLEQWRLPAEKYELNMVSFFLNGTVSCIESTYSSNWHYKYSDRIRYFNDILNSKIFQYAILKKSKLNSGYITDVIWQLVHKNFIGVILLVKIKFLLKKYFCGLFKIIKKRI